MLSIEDFSISYSSNQVIDNLSLSFEEGQIHGLVGLNGSGKTTLLKGIYGLIKPDKGGVFLNGRPLTKAEIDFLETENFFYSRITGIEYLKLFQARNKKFNIQEWNKLFELPLNSLIESYSTGMRKKLAFIGILCLDKPILILDEPFNGLDLDTTQKIKTIIKTLKQKGKTIIVTSHILESLTNICDTISYLNNKKIAITFDQGQFDNIEHKIFGEFNLTNEKMINKLLDNSEEI